MIATQPIARPELPIWPFSGAAAKEKVVERGEPGRPDRKITGVAVATLTAYVPDSATGDAIIICPGGGYAGLSIDREGHDVAHWLAREGIAGLVLKYRLGRGSSDAGVLLPPLADVLQAISVARRHAGEWGIDARRIGLMGFSAGGHMAAYAANEDPHVAFSVLVYPLISMETEWTHLYSRRHLLGRRPDADSVKHYSMEYGVSAQTAPAFLVHAHDDDVVKIANSQRYTAALQRYGVAHESKFFERGGHGFGLGEAAGPTGTWPRLCLNWLRDKRLLAAPAILP